MISLRLPQEVVEEIHRINVRSQHHEVMAELAECVSWLDGNVNTSSSLLWKRTNLMFVHYWERPGNPVWTLTTYDLVMAPILECVAVACRSCYDNWCVTVDTRVMVERYMVKVEVGLLNNCMEILHGLEGVSPQWEVAPFYMP